MSSQDQRTPQVATSIYVSFVGMSTLLALVLPDRAESYPHAMRMLADLIEGVVPSIHSFALVSSFPVVTRMFLAVQWLLVPVLAALVSKYPSLVRPNQRTIRDSSRVKLCLLLVAALALFIVYPATMQVQTQDLIGGLLHERALASASRSRLWMGLIGSSTIFFVAYFIALILSYVRVLFFESRSQGE